MADSVSRFNDQAAASLAEAYFEQGRIREAMRNQRRAVEAAPDDAALHSRLLYMLNFDPDCHREMLFREHQDWARRHGHPSQRRSVRQRPMARRPLRIGYVSGEFRDHPTMRFFRPILENHDRRRFDIFLYGEVRRADATTAHVQELANWRSTLGHDAATVARQIEADRIDVLIDLAGHASGNRLDIFALAPAPVQASYMAYPNTTGLSTVDYRITDAVVDPPEECRWMTEEPFYLQGGSLCFQPCPGPEIAPPPALRGAGITFGSPHQICKLNDDVLVLWKQVLEAVPGSRLALVRSTLSAEAIQSLRERLVNAGISPERCLFLRPGPGAEYLRAAEEIDVMLDAFPFSGHTTSCEFLWMGVPVVTLRGDRPSSRVTASILTTLGRTELIASRADEYVTIAHRLASDISRLCQLRSAFRPLMRERLCNGAAFTRRLEVAYEEMYLAQSSLTLH